ncbi:3-oxo-5-alpha-steroid 4-dehydrogenase-domain-containing protein [Phanerochaete sordida]|uniref:3-oxo-5-alpha-steroid 4-dehydrogenase-domain-containing protein n=1 Tax=Phanerochaete sordida TaxID=48140 RepID=A0A9P3GAX3_9APHY|nr:3-oxo-5-alpha-steroid 4-dehydrogenase-domain-containing protein [Phanerochaete sordida]
MTRAEVAQIQGIYDMARRAFILGSCATAPLTFFVDAPFGRFALKNQDSFLIVDGIKAWIAMELVAPLSFIYSFLHSPLSPANFGHSPPLSLSHPPTFLSALFLIHYLNRAIVSPLRTPSRSKSHLAVALCAVSFNIVNGSLMGSYLSSPSADLFLTGAFSRPLFWLGVGLWAFGYVGNILHDEVLLNLRRSAQAKGKARAQNDDDDDNGKSKKQEHYAIPYGYLYQFISYPNYFCEWLEWLGFALAASPVPSFTSVSAFLASATPPFVFFITEVLLMLPRAYRGHKWYHSKFPDYPKERKAVIPFLF